MKVAEMQRRENFSDILCSTLEKGWMAQYDSDIAISTQGTKNGANWFLNRQLSAVFPENVSEEVRTFLRNGFRYSPVRFRMPMQWLFGTLISTSVGLYLSAQPIFSVNQHLQDQSKLLVVPGNQRIRIFNFVSNKSRVLLKKGFDSRTMINEINIRGKGGGGPFFQIETWAEDCSWFEEPFIDGFSLPRTPFGVDRVGLESISFAKLKNWLDQSEITEDAHPYVDELEKRIRHYVDCVLLPNYNDHASVLLESVKSLSEIGKRFEKLPSAKTHGDFQSGNILITHDLSEVYIIDWEHSRRRFKYYDQLVYLLRSRWPHGLKQRINIFLANPIDDFRTDNFHASRDWRQMAIAVFLLEDILWVLQENMYGNYSHPSDGLKQYISEILLMRSEWSELFS